MSRPIRSRRVDPLASLTADMRFALKNVDDCLTLRDGFYRSPTGRCHAPATVRALAERGLLRLSAGPDGLLKRFVLTPAGMKLAEELSRRATVRAALIAERQGAR